MGAAALVASCCTLCSGDTLIPVVTGGLKDTSPRDGLADAIESGAFIASVTGGEYRAIAEFDVTDVPSGLVLSANVTGTIGPNNSVDVGLREHLIEFYTADGVLGLDDFSVPGIYVGDVAHASGDRTDFDFDITGILHNLLAAGATHVGMRVSPQTELLPFDVLYTNELFSDAPRINFELLPEGAGTLQVLPSLDAEFELVEGVWEVDETSNTINPRWIDFADIDRRGALEFSLADLPDNVTITDAKIEFDIWSLGGGAGDTTDAPIYGYAGDGAMTVADVLDTSTQIGVLGPVEELDPIRVELDHEFINTLLQNGEEFLGLAILGDPDYNSVGFATTDFAASSSSAVAPQLFLTYVPNEAPAGLPGDFNDDGVVDAADYTVWRDHQGAADEAALSGNGDGLSGVGQGDYAVWRDNYGATSDAGPATTAPAPAAATLLVAAMVAAGARQLSRSSSSL
ncbi:hypothetical protein [Posidoniimonas corsicana]|uniref:hypothetical protein n=1 Tax=Posidoniimonas corsicana TaxID=1938618 RepID=UPI0018D292AB|nr:hypothetical protein [Posidoniimonas corsicana]